MVADGDLYAHDGVDHHHVLFHVPGEGVDGQPVGTGEGVGGDALLIVGAGLSDEVLHAAGDAVGAQQAQHGGDAAAHDNAELAPGR